MNVFFFFFFFFLEDMCTYLYSNNDGLLKPIRDEKRGANSQDFMFEDIAKNLVYSINNIHRSFIS